MFFRCKKAHKIKNPHKGGKGKAERQVDIENRIRDMVTKDSNELQVQFKRSVY